MRFMNLSILLITFLISGCATPATLLGVGDEAQNIRENVKYSPLVDLAQNEAGIQKQQSVDILSWFTEVVNNEAPTCLQGIDDPEFHKVMMCFDTALSDTKKVSYRNAFVDYAIFMSDRNCEIRLSSLERGNSYVNTGTGMIKTVATQVGTLTPDTMTSRVASAFAGGAEDFFSTTRSNMLSANTVSLVRKNITETRTAKATTIDSKDKKGSPTYSEWPVTAALRDLQNYDQTCDLFK